jgi:hypothetical protein
MGEACLFKPLAKGYLDHLLKLAYLDHLLKEAWL